MTSKPQHDDTYQSHFYFFYAYIFANKEIIVWLTSLLIITILDTYLFSNHNLKTNLIFYQ